MVPADQENLNVKEAAEVARTSTFTIRGWIKKKKLKATQPGATGKPHKRGGAPYLIKRVDLNETLAQHATTEPAE